tara:strand:+ start:2710 stop:3717 length:1008 start_codon:yes stop_codon:yes gene_type:complete
MSNQVRTILRNATRKQEEPLNILTFPTHERYQTNLAETGHNFYMWQSQGIKPWVNKYGPIPKNTVLLNADKKDKQVPADVDIDIVLSQNKFGQFEIAKKISEQIGAPLVSIEHTLPMTSWPKSQLIQLHKMRGDINLFISEYSRALWGWSDDEAGVVHHGVDTELFCPSDLNREPLALSVVNDWINRDWCCGYKLWEAVTGFPKNIFPLQVIGDTPGLSEPAPSTESLVKEYQTARVFLNTSLISPVPTSLLEAMSCGCAVVTTETCMIPEIIKNGENGFMSNNPSELRGYVQKLMEDEELAKELGKNARATIVNNFSLSKFVDTWKNVFMAAVE